MSLSADHYHRSPPRPQTRRARRRARGARQRAPHGSAEARRLLASLGAAQGTQKGIIEARLDELGGAIAAAEAQFTEIERQLLAHEQKPSEASWVAGMLESFDAVWKIISAENRRRLVHAVVRRIEVNEPANAIEVRLYDLGVEVVEGSGDAARRSQPPRANGVTEEVHV